MDTTRTLNMKFEAADGTVSVAVKNCKDGLTGGKVGTVMDGMIASGLFAKELRAKSGAEVVMRSVEKLI